MADDVLMEGMLDGWVSGIVEEGGICRLDGSCMSRWREGGYMRERAVWV